MLPKVWNININSAPKEYMESLRVFFEAGSFLLYPDVDNTLLYHHVYWTKDTFDPTYIAPNQYSLNASIKETTIGAGVTYIPGQGDQTINGNLLVTGDLAVQGAINASEYIGIEAEEIGAGTFGGGDFSFDSLLHCTTIEAINNLWSKENVLAWGGLYANYNGTPGDSFVYFYNDTTTGAYLKFNNTNDIFTLSHDLDVDGVILSGGTDLADIFSDAGAITAEDVGVGNFVGEGFKFEEHLIIESTLEVADNVWAKSALLSEGDVHMNYSGPDDDSYLYFYNNTSTTGAYIKWEDSASRFSVSHDFSIENGVLTVGADVAQSSLRFGSGAGLGLLGYDTGNTQFTFYNDVNVAKDLKTQGDFYISYSAGTLRPRVYFHDGSDPDGAYLGFDTGTTLYTISHGLRSLGALSGTALYYGSEDTDDRYFKVDDDNVHASAVTAGDFLGNTYGFADVIKVSGGTIAVNENKGGFGRIFFSGTQATIHHAAGGVVFKDTSSEPVTFENSIIVDGNYSGISMAKGITIIEPLATDEATMWFTDRAITVNQTNTVVRGTGTPTATWTIQFDADRSAGGTSINAGLSNDDTTGLEDTSMITASVPADSWIWCELLATGGTSVDEFHVTMKYTED